VITATFSQSTRSTPSATQPKPTTAPTIACVVETGQPKYEAINSHVPAAISAAIIPHARTKAASSPWIVTSCCGSNSFLRTVSETFAPTKYAPRNSKIPARMTARLRVRAPDPTDVPMALATSFAPMFQAM